MSLNSIVDFLDEQEAMGVNITFDSCETDINKEIIDIYKKDKEEGILIWMDYLRNALDEFAEDYIIKALTSGTVDDFVKKFGIREFIATLNEYLELRDMLFRESEYISIKFFDKLIRTFDCELYKTYLEIVCCNRNLKDDDNDGLENLLRELSKRMWLVEPENYDEFASELNSYSSIVSDFTAAVLKFYLTKNNEAIDSVEKGIIYKQCSNAMKEALINKSVLNDSDQNAINECLNELLKLDFESGCSVWIDIVTIYNSIENEYDYLEEEICGTIPNYIAQIYGSDTVINIIEDNDAVYNKIILTGRYAPSDFLRKLYKEYSGELFIKYFYPVLKNVKFTSNSDGYYLERLLIDLAETAPSDRRLYTVLQGVLNKVPEDFRNEIINNVGSITQPKTKVGKLKKQKGGQYDYEPELKIAIDIIRRKMVETDKYYALSRMAKENEIREALREYKEMKSLETIDIIRGNKDFDSEDFFDFLMGFSMAKSMYDNGNNRTDFDNYENKYDNYQDEAETYMDELSEYEDLGLDIEDLDSFDDVDGFNFDYDFDNDDFSVDDYDYDDFSSDDNDSDSIDGDYDRFDSDYGSSFDSFDGGSGDYD